MATASPPMSREKCAAAPVSSARRYGPASANRSSECQNREEADPPFADLGRGPSGGLCFGAPGTGVVPAKRSSNVPPVNRLYALIAATLLALQCCPKATPSEANHQWKD